MTERPMMTPATAWCAAALLLLGLGACREEALVRERPSGSGAALPEPGNTPPDVAAALEQATALVDATASATAEGLEVSPQPGNGELEGCDTEEGPQHEYTSYGVSIALDDDGAGLLDDVKSFWDAQGYDVRQDAPDAVYLSFDGFDFELFVNSQSHRAFLGGSTPCYAPA